MESKAHIETKMMYNSFCDILGFSSAIENNFEATTEIYMNLKSEILEIVKIPEVEVSIYSDAILVVGNELSGVVHAVKQIYWFCLLHDLLIRGGIAYGKHWSNVEGNSILILSEALVKAVKIEKTIKLPIIAVSDEIEIPTSAWVIHFENSVFQAPFLNYQNINFVNPFNELWFKSAEIRIKNLKNKFPKHSAKYDWLLNLIERVKANDILIPENQLNFLIKEGVLAYKKNE